MIASKPLIAILSVAMAVLACSFASALAEENIDYSGIHTVAVISALGDDIPMVAYGTTRFDNAQYTLHTDWKIDTALQQRVSDILSARFKVVTPAVDTSAFNNVGPTAFDTIWDVLQKRVQSLTKLNGIDAYVIIIPQQHSLGGETWRGVQVTHEHSWIVKDSATMTAYYSVAVVSASDGKRIAGGRAEYPASGFISGFSQPFVICSNDIWSDTAEGLFQEKKDQLRQETTVLIDKGLMGALIGANLIGNDEAAAYAQSHPTPPDIPQCRQL